MPPWHRGPAACAADVDVYDRRHVDIDVFREFVIVRHQYPIRLMIDIERSRCFYLYVQLLRFQTALKTVLLK